MSNNNKWVKMENAKSNVSNINKKSSNASKDPGIYTCPTCNALFTCLQYYQQHVKQHAEANGTKLLCCNYCRYSSEIQFQYNWHLMSHKEQTPHSCSVCMDKSANNYNNNNHVNGKEDEKGMSLGKSSRKAQQNGNNCKKIKYNNKVYSKNNEEIEDDDDEDAEDEEESGDEDSDEESEELEAEEADENEESEDAEEEEVDEEEEEEEDEEDDEDDEEEEVEEENEQVDINQLQPGQAYQQDLINQHQTEDQEISDDEDDDDEEEVESEADDGENNELPEEYLVAQRLNSEVYHYEDMQSQQNHLNSNLINNNSGIVLDINQGPPYTKSTVVDIVNPDLLNTDGIICNKGRGKGNRKSRTINQMGGAVDDELSQLRRKFHCSHCGKSFKTKSHLQRHILTHTGEKPYHCNRCGAKFNQSSSLRNHIIAIHTKEYPHFCNHCNKGFLMPALLQKHLQTSHRDQQDQQHE